MLRITVIAFITILISCKGNHQQVELTIPTKSDYLANQKELTNEVYFDKVLGALVGSAIGDAMGASTEMWHRHDIQKEYGFITKLTPALREKSPEGTWGHNLGTGTTTDDTRWKYLMTKYFSRNNNNQSPRAFAKFITDYYATIAGDLSEKALDGSDALDEQLDKVNWILEWDRVAKAYQKDGQSYQETLGRFYGGEMSCAGMLYSPMFGLVNNAPEQAYKEAYENALFDIGYAKDITALAAAMTSVAMQVNDIDSIVNTIKHIDPRKFRNSRLIGRLSESAATVGVDYVEAATKIDTTATEENEPPSTYPYSTSEWVRLNFIFDQLELTQMPIAFHAGEIWQILITGLEYGEGDFQKTMEFIVNYGRDNDTVAAVAGMILGAQLGYDALPQEMKTQIVAVNKDQLGIDLELLAKEITATKTGFN